ncbi:MAG: methionine adenosyltransferase [Patescibacteria group bacterium]
MNIFFASKDFEGSKEIEIIERKGAGHPDTLADGLAEHLSISFSNYSLERFGAVLHHNFDKVGLLGGTSYVAFAEGYLVSPIRVLINGRMSTKFGNERIPTKKLLINWTKEFFRKHLPLIDPDEDLEFHLNLSSQSSPGKTYEKDAKRSARQRWFEPENLADLPELNKLMSNDTSVGVGYAPSSSLEIIGLEIENSLNSDEYREQNLWIGSDIKVMGVRNRDKYYFTICIPQIAKRVKNLEDYVKNLSEARKYIGNILLKHNINDGDYELSINTRDNYDLAELYLTATGSSIESGDEGLAGRGNRVNKLISPTKPMSMEGSCGKNPVYHIGKIYYVAAFNLANKIYEKLGIENEVYIISQSGRDLLDPWIIAVYTQKGLGLENELRKIIEDEITHLPEITGSILKGEIRIY